jgi:MFS family permease
MSAASLELRVSCIWVGDRLSRRRTIFLGSAIMVIGAILQCTSFTLAHFIVGRLVTGYGNGLNTSTMPTWQSECSKSHRRGQLVMVEGALVTGGVCISYWLDFGCSFINNQASWRFPIAFQIVFALTIMTFILKLPELPESPRWLLLKGKEDEAMNVLGVLGDLPPTITMSTLSSRQSKTLCLKCSKVASRTSSPWTRIAISTAWYLHTSIRCSSICKSSWRLFPKQSSVVFFWAHLISAFSHNSLRPTICFNLADDNALRRSGINLITYYAATIYQNEIGLSPFMSRILAACNGTEYFLASWITVFMIETIGRRKLMLFGAAGQLASMVILAVMTKIGGTTPGIVAAAFLFIFNTFFAVGWPGYDVALSCRGAWGVGQAGFFAQACLGRPMWLAPRPIVA